MENISNAKIEKLKADIGKSRTKIAEYQAKLKEQEKLLITLEDLEIVARFRTQQGNEDLAAKLRSGKQNEPPRVLADGAGQVKEEALDDSV
jgi:excinuclease UvrABC helicase subunit UvrB